MHKAGIRFFIICCYCFPFAYLSMYRDFTNGSMDGYLLMISVMSALAFFSTLTGNFSAVIMGNLLSALFSFLLNGNMSENSHYDGYFKPLSPGQLLILVSLLNLLPQSLAMCAVARIKGKRSIFTGEKK